MLRRDDVNNQIIKTDQITYIVVKTCLKTELRNTITCLKIIVCSDFLVRTVAKQSASPGKQKREEKKY